MGSARWCRLSEARAKEELGSQHWQWDDGSYLAFPMVFSMNGRIPRVDCYWIASSNATR